MIHTLHPDLEAGKNRGRGFPRASRVAASCSSLQAGRGVEKFATHLPSSASKAPAIKKVKVIKGGVAGSLKRMNPVNRA